MKKSVVNLFTVGIVSSLLFTGFGTVAAQTTSNSIIQSVKSSGVLNVGFEGTYPPFNYMNNKYQFARFDVDISNAIAHQLGVKTAFVPGLWATLIGGLKANKFEIICAEMAVTPARKQQVDFTNPYEISGAVILTRKNTNDIHNLAALKGKRVGVVGGTLFQKVADSVKGAEVHLYTTTPTMEQDLVDGRIDAFIDDKSSEEYVIHHDKLPIKIASGLVDKYDIAMAVQKGHPHFLAAVNKALATIKKNGTYNKIYKKWFGALPNGN